MVPAEKTQWYGLWFAVGIPDHNAGGRIFLESDGVNDMDNDLILHNNLKAARTEKKLSQDELARMVGVSRQTISSIETGQFNPTAKLALLLCIALDQKFEDLFYF